MGKKLEDEDVIFLKYQLKPICAPLAGNVLILKLISRGSQQRSSNKQSHLLERKIKYIYV